MHQKNETGRSLLEVIAIIAVIGVLLIAALVGFKGVMDYFRHKDTAKEIASLGMRNKLRPGRGRSSAEGGKRIRIKDICPECTECEENNAFCAKTKDGGRITLETDGDSGSAFWVIAQNIDPQSCREALLLGGYSLAIGGSNLTKDDLPNKTEDMQNPNFFRMRMGEANVSQVIADFCCEAAPEQEAGRNCTQYFLYGDSHDCDFYYDGGCHDCPKGKSQAPSGREASDEHGCCISSHIECGRCGGCPNGQSCPHGQCIECGSDADCRLKGDFVEDCDGRHFGKNYCVNGICGPCKVSGVQCEDINGNLVDGIFCNTNLQCDCNEGEDCTPTPPKWWNGTQCLCKTLNRYDVCGYDAPNICPCLTGFECQQETIENIKAKTSADNSVGLDTYAEGETHAYYCECPTTLPDEGGSCNTTCGCKDVNSDGKPLTCDIGTHTCTSSGGSDQACHDETGGPYGTFSESSGIYTLLHRSVNQDGSADKCKEGCPCEDPTGGDLVTCGAGNVCICTNKPTTAGATCVVGCGCASGVTCDDVLDGTLGNNIGKCVASEPKLYDDCGTHPPYQQMCTNTPSCGDLLLCNPNSPDDGRCHCACPSPLPGPGQNCHVDCGCSGGIQCTPVSGGKTGICGCTSDDDCKNSTDGRVRCNFDHPDAVGDTGICDCPIGFKYQETFETMAGETIYASAEEGEQANHCVCDQEGKQYKNYQWWKKPGTTTDEKICCPLENHLSLRSNETYDCCPLGWEWYTVDGVEECWPICSGDDSITSIAVILDYSHSTRDTSYGGTGYKYTSYTQAKNIIDLVNEVNPDIEIALYREDNSRKTEDTDGDGQICSAPDATQWTTTEIAHFATDGTHNDPVIKTATKASSINENILKQSLCASNCGDGMTCFVNATDSITMTKNTMVFLFSDGMIPGNTLSRKLLVGLSDDDKNRIYAYALGATTALGLNTGHESPWSSSPDKNTMKNILKTKICVPQDQVNKS